MLMYLTLIYFNRRGGRAEIAQDPVQIKYHRIRLIGITEVRIFTRIFCSEIEWEK